MQAELPAGWTSHTSSRTGRTFYFHAATGKRQWVHPGQFASSASGSVASNKKTGSLEASSSVDPSQPSAKRARVGVAAGTVSAAKVASAYDAQPERKKEERAQSKIKYLLAFQNWVKSVLIDNSVPKPCTRVLDLACGKLGDIRKWKIAGVTRYCGVDISKQQVLRAVDRLNELNGGATSKIRARLVEADLGVCDLATSPAVQQEEEFDAVSIQFALHYLFQSEAIALQFFRNLAGRLAPGGVFVGTMIDADVIVRLLREEHARVRRRGAPADPKDKDPLRVLRAAGSPTGQAAAATGSSSTAASSASPADDKRLFLDHGKAPPVKATIDGREMELGGGSAVAAAHDASLRAVTVGNPLFSITMGRRDLARQYALGKNPFGCGYEFFLTESVERVREYLCPPALLERMCRSCGLVPVLNENFHDFFDRHGKGPGKYRDLLSRMGVFDGEGQLGEHEWEVAGLYRAFCFRRDAGLPISIRPAPQVLDPLRVPQLKEREYIYPDHVLCLRADGSWEGGGVEAYDESMKAELVVHEEQEGEGQGEAGAMQESKQGEIDGVYESASAGEDHAGVSSGAGQQSMEQDRGSNEHEEAAKSAFAGSTASESVTQDEAPFGAAMFSAGGTEDAASSAAAGQPADEDPSGAGESTSAQLYSYQGGDDDDGDDDDEMFE